MTKVEVFPTLKEADEKLLIHFSRNRDLVISIFHELQARAEVYKQSADFQKLHPEEEETGFTIEEILLLSKGLGRGETATALVKLYSFDLNLYGFDQMVFNPSNILTFAPYDSIDILAENVLEQVKQEKSKHLDFRVEPVFYTVLEPFSYSEQDKLESREALGYKAFSREDKLIFDKHINDYVERALTSAEIKRFISAYTKFLN
ncbi:MAG: hypothetical protein Q7S55_02785 [Nanoarchaeota archaeon]|nr:hypothetical protein [Nanoarchaeota archaeon]